jgi:uncharacterized OB-fold protein
VTPQAETHKPYLPADLSRLNPDMDTKEFWDWCNNGELRIQRCRGCGKFRHPPLPGCRHCGCRDYEYVKSSGKGTIYTYSLVYHPVIPVVNQSVPYNVISVELEDCGGVRIVSNLLDAEFEEIKIGLPVELVWERISAEGNLPRFRRVKKT